MVPKGVELNAGQFSGCVQLREVVFADGCQIAELPEGAFEGCCALKAVALPKTVTVIKRNSFANSGIAAITIPKSVGVIEERAFDRAGDLAIVMFEEGSELRQIGSWAFNACTCLQTISLPAGLQTIGDSCFQSSGLAEIVIPDSVVTIMPSAFSACQNLVSV